MFDLARTSPFRRLAQADPFARRSLDDLFKGFFLTPMAPDNPDVSAFPVDVSENDTSYTVRAEIPGFAKEEIDVSVDGDRVSISAETKKENEEKKGGQVVWKECHYGRQYRSFSLPQAVDETKTSAKYHNGVLQLVLPKKGNGSQKKIAIA